VIDEQIRLECRIQLLQQTIGHRRTGKAELSDARGIGRFKVRVVNQIVVKRRNQVKVGDFFRLDDREGLPRIVTWQTDKAAADQRHRDQGAHPHGVVERHHAEGPLVAAVEVLRHMGDAGGPFGAVTARHAFRLRRRPRRIEHDRPRLRAYARRGFRRGRIGHLRKTKGLVVGRDALADNNVAQIAREPGAGDRACGNAFVDESLGFGVLDAEIEFVGFRAPIDRRDDDSGQLARPMNCRGFPSVLQHGDDVVAGSQSEVVECGDYGRYPRIPLRVGQPQLGVHDCHSAGIACHAGDETGTEIKHLSSLHDDGLPAGLRHRERRG